MLWDSFYLFFNHSCSSDATIWVYFSQMCPPNTFNPALYNTHLKGIMWTNWGLNKPKNGNTVMFMFSCSTVDALIQYFRSGTNMVPADAIAPTISFLGTQKEFQAHSNQMYLFANLLNKRLLEIKERKENHVSFSPWQKDDTDIQKRQQKEATDIQTKGVLIT